MSSEYTFVTIKNNDSFIAIVPELPGVVAESDDINSLKPRVKEAIDVYIKTLHEEKLHMPPKLEVVEVGQVEVDNE